MTIKDAKQQILDSIRAYLIKDEFGEYLIPEEEQRPVFLIGAPGIGKTAIMQQIAQELGVGLVSYSMTHHTRQSALGLPYIEKKNYAGREYSVSEYTMSEIIASVYDLMEDTGVSEGILFIDEINCVSETLAPSMLQFLQYKVFGRHKVPHGWIVVTAGNPPEYNNSVREFDIVTWDRLKVVEVEPDYEVWKEYAYKKAVHPSITTYLDIKKDDFYAIQTTVEGKTFVTARGWVDLSKMIYLFEKNDFKVDETLVIQYLQNGRTAKEFMVYYDLYNKYREEYPVDAILDGEIAEDIKDRVSEAGFDEVYTLIGLLLSALKEDVRECIEEHRVLESVKLCVNEFKTASEEGISPSANMARLTERISRGRESGLKARSLTREESDRMLRTLSCLYDLSEKIAGTDDYESALGIIREEYGKLVRAHNEKAEAVRGRMDNLFAFADACWGDDKEMLMIVTEVTADPECVSFISMYGCDGYYQHNKSLLFDERSVEIERQIAQLDL